MLENDDGIVTLKIVDEEDGGWDVIEGGLGGTWILWSLSDWMAPDAVLLSLAPWRTLLPIFNVS